MREILFKEKSLDNVEWVEGDLLHTGDVNTVLIRDCYCQLFRCDGSTVCQYTGFTDKNGKRIWENDILCGHVDDLYPEDITYEKIIWNENGFFVKENHSINFYLLDRFEQGHFEVCGNIFDDKELLEVE